VGPDAEKKSRRKVPLRVIIIEEILILASLGLLFVLGVFYRQEIWAQICLTGILVVMLLVFVIRSRRVQRAFKEREE